MSMALSIKHQEFVEAFLTHNFNGTEAYQEVYGVEYNVARASAPRLLAKVSIASEIKRRIEEKSMGADEVLIKLAEQARGDMRFFFKVVEEWTFYPLPTYEIIDAKEVEDTTDLEKPRIRISYWVRHICVDMDKVMDPQYSHLLSEFTDSPKNGLGIKIYSKQSALQTMAKIRGLMVDRTENLNIDLSTLTDEQLEMIAQGKRITDVLKHAST